MKMMLLIIISAALLIAGAAGARAQDYTCGDHICQPNENHASCPGDCQASARDSYCNDAEDSVCDPDCFRTDPDCNNYSEELTTEPATIPGFVKIAGILLFFAAFGAAMFYLYKRSQKGQNMYDVKQIDQFSNVKKQEEKNWANSTETEIVKNIEQTEDFQKFKEGGGQG